MLEILLMCHGKPVLLNCVPPPLLGSAALAVAIKYVKTYAQSVQDNQTYENVFFSNNNNKHDA